jgi:hypothetical protein
MNFQNGHILIVIEGRGSSQKSLKKDPNPPAPNITQFYQVQGG